MSMSEWIHKHLCPKCGHVWEHSAVEAWKLEAEGIEPHNCPECGTFEKKIYHPHKPKPEETTQP